MRARRAEELNQAAAGKGPGSEERLTFLPTLFSRSATMLEIYERSAREQVAGTAGQERMMLKLGLSRRWPLALLTIFRYTSTGYNRSLPHGRINCGSTN
jgi:hypothetical protein